MFWHCTTWEPFTIIACHNDPVHRFISSLCRSGHMKSVRLLKEEKAEWNMDQHHRQNYFHFHHYIPYSFKSMAYGLQPIVQVYQRVHAGAAKCNFHKSWFKFFFVILVLCFNIQINLLEYPSPATTAPCPSQKPSHGDISGTKRGIIDPLVTKRPK